MLIFTSQEQIDEFIKNKTIHMFKSFVYKSKLGCDGTIIFAMPDVTLEMSIYAENIYGNNITAEGISASSIRCNNLTVKKLNCENVKTVGSLHVNKSTRAGIHS